MTTLGRLFATDLFFLLIVGISWVAVLESSMENTKRWKIALIQQRTMIGLTIFGVILILLAIWGVR